MNLRLVFSSIVVFFGLFLVGFVAFTWPRAGVTIANFDRIKVGMHKSTVVAILGSAPKYFPNEPRPLVICLGTGSIAAAIMEDQSYVWDSADCVIFVHFESEWKVDGKSIHHRYHESLYDKFRRLLQLTPLVG